MVFMTKTEDERAARYFPFQKGSIDRRVIRSAPDSDREVQRRAVRKVTINQVSILVARPFWVLPAVNAFTVGTPYWLIGAIVAVISVVIIAVLYAIASHARDGLRVADETVGVPLPDDLIDEVVEAGNALHAMQNLYELAAEDDLANDRIRPHRRRLFSIDGRYVRSLHAARRHWVASDMAEWREDATDLSDIAREAAYLVGFLSDRVPPFGMDDDRR